MNLLWNIHLYPPHHNCGSEWMAHCINRYLIDRGHNVRVVLNQAKINKVKVPYNYEGVDVFGPNGSLDQYRWADVILTHLDYTQKSIVIGDIVKKPVMNFIHNDIPYPSILYARRNNYVVYNSQWVAEKLNYKWPSMILYPPCDVDYYNVCEKPIDNECITLISLNENKGGKIFYEVARRMPDRKFLGVLGSYDEQFIEELPNVEILPNTPDVRQIYQRTRILLMPSRYESWGRTATEAMANGIPVICTPTPGLKENCGDAGLYITSRGDLKKNGAGEVIGDDAETYDVSSIIKQIRKLDKENFYEAVSKRCRERAVELNPKNQLHELEQFIYERGSN